MSSVTSAPKQRTGRGERSFGLDVARALAAVGVLVTHVAFATGIENPERLASPLRDILPRLDVGVSVFFVLSGLLVGRPFVRRLIRGEPGPAFRPYAIRRASRIYPVYWFVLIVTLVTVGHGGPMEVIADVFLLHVYNPSWAIGPITQSWTLATEVGFYLFLPAFFAVLGRYLDRTGVAGTRERARWVAMGLWVWVLIALGWRIGVVLGTPTYDFAIPGAVDTRGALLTWLPNHLDAFAIGVAMALALETGNARRLSRIARLGSYAIGLVALWIVSTRLGLTNLFTGFDGPQTHLRHLLFLVVATAAVLPSAFARAESPMRRPDWVPPPWTAQIAKSAALASYGVYLWHQWVTHKWFTSQDLTEFAAPFPTALGFVVVVSTAAAALTYWFVERPATTLATGRGGGTPSPEPRQLGPQRSLDGIRGLAIAAVLGTHIVFLDAGSSTWSLRGGFLGVDVFLGLSAFLIAAVLLRELDSTDAQLGSPGLDLGGFAKRRLRRLYPPLVVFLVLAGTISVLLLPTTLTQLLGQSALALTFTANWQLSWGSHPPFELAHLWSLSLEAQFYLLMALGFWLWRRRLKRPQRNVALLILLAAGVALWRLWLFERGVELTALYERTGARADSMLLGVAAALIWRSRLVSDEVLRKVGLAALVVIGGAMVFGTADSPWLFGGGFTIIGAASAAVVAAAVTGTGVVAIVGRWGPLRWVGEISYSLYLWHLPIYIWTVKVFGDDAPLITKVAVAVPLSVLAGWASYRLVETRVLAAWRRRGSAG